MVHVGDFVIISDSLIYWITGEKAGDYKLITVINNVHKDKVVFRTNEEIPDSVWNSAKLK